MMSRVLSKSPAPQAPGAGGNRAPVVPSVPGLNLLRPRLPARRARVAAVLTVCLVVTALIDLGVVLAWSGLSIANNRMVHLLNDLALRKEIATASVAARVPAARERANLRHRLALLEGLPSGFRDSQLIMEHLTRGLPPGAALTSASLTPDGHVVISGSATSYAAVEAYVRFLQGVGDFAYVRVATSALEAAGQNAGGAPEENAAGGVTAGVPGSRVSFQLEAWLREERVQ